MVKIEETLVSGEAIADPQESLQRCHETWEATEEVLGVEHIKRFEVHKYTCLSAVWINACMWSRVQYIHCTCSTTFYAHSVCAVPCMLY